MSARENIWGLMPLPALTIGADDRVAALNGAGESFLGVSEAQIRGQSAAQLFGDNARLMEILRIARVSTATAADHNVEFLWPNRPSESVDMLAAADETGEVLIILQRRSIAEHIDRSLNHRNAARSMTGMASMLAHEIKNPLAGISGAAQLLEMSVGEEDGALARLIRDESKRIEKLINRVEAFGGAAPLKPEPVNIHDVLDRAKRSAQAGFAAHVTFRELYDPSLPEVPGDQDQLIQVMLNLLKNAAEAAPAVGGLITLRTAYRAGVAMSGPRGARVSMPLLIEIADNGVGVPQDILNEIFEPFVSSKSTGGGLGLSLVAKIVAEHGGAVECQSEPGRTVFRLRFPIWQGTGASA